LQQLFPYILGRNSFTRSFTISQRQSRKTGAII